jgi:8-oxo-dGTP diphosphatase
MMKVSDQGASINRYSVIPRTLIFIFDQAGKVLLLKGYKHKRLWSEKWNGLGGHVEQGEDIISSAKRELFEESGIKSADLLLCGLVSINTLNIPGIILFIFKSFNHNGTVCESCDGELAWFGLEELPQIPRVDDLEILIPKVMAFKEGDPIFYALSEPDQYGELKIRFT